MKPPKRRLLLPLTALALLCACARPASPSPVSPLTPSPSPVTPSQSGLPAAPAGGAFTVTFDYVKQSGSASNQFAVWFEDSGGNHVKTLYATRYTAGGGYRARPDSLALWVARSGLASMPRSEVDAISGATPQTGALIYVWEDAPPGIYTLRVEGTLRWKNFVLYTAVFDTSAGAADISPSPEYTYAASGSQRA
ncbi:MAG: DUF2271 domain-containing protein, partial [Oscillospiraceae bacterium]|nr:DUF2271 domain-containing protein [Oscillospiraceae bacterium]